MKALYVVVFLVIASGLGYFGYEYWRERPQLPVETAAPSAAPTPEVRYPVPSATVNTGLGSEKVDAKSLPGLDESDNSTEAALAEVFGAKALKLLHLDELIRRTVATVEALAGMTQPSDESSLFRPLETDFLVAEMGGAQVIDRANFKRYAAFVSIGGAVDVEKFVALYVRFYPLLQSAYDELGTKRYFNDRLVQVIDMALQAPDPEGPLNVVKPGEKYRYKFEDERLENLPSVQKVLVRMGSENARVLRAKLRSIRERLVALGKN